MVQTYSSLQRKLSFLQPDSGRLPGFYYRHSHLFYCFWLAVIGWHGRADDAAGFGYRLHVADMDEVEGEYPALLK